MIGVLWRSVLGVAVGLALYVLDFRASLAIPHDIMGTSFQTTTLFIVTVVSFVAIMTPAFQDRWALGTRAAFTIAGFVLLGVAVGNSIGITHFDAMHPLAGTKPAQIAIWRAIHGR